jgi:mRNA-degrading endonuclease RelE of RelBE toxin-antitoxin system
VSEDASPERIVVIWSPEARADLRAIEREIAMQILHCIDRYLSTRAGDVKKLKPPRTDFRLRCGDYRLFFDFRDENTIEISGVRHRREAYR